MNSVIKAPEREEAIIPWFDLEVHGQNDTESLRLQHQMSKTIMLQNVITTPTFEDPTCLYGSEKVKCLH